MNILFSVSTIALPIKIINQMRNECSCQDTRFLRKIKFYVFLKAVFFLSLVYCPTLKVNKSLFTDSPWVSDPNIPLVAREIMQRMIQQFAAEYTSKTSSTQDPSQPNSTKNQSLPKASPVTTSPTAATTQNPVLSKLLMADQDSPLDLTVRKSQSEPSEQGMV